MFVFSTVYGADDNCEGSGEYSDVCGPQSAEDLVLIPDTKWIIASGDVLLSPGFDLEEFASSPVHEHFSNTTIALQVGAGLWIATFAGDRIACRSLQP